VKKWFFRITAAFLGLFLLLFLAVFYLLGTENGTFFVIAQTEKLLDESLQIGSSKGKILDRLELSDIVFSNATGTAKAGHLVLDWKSTDLLNLHFHILEFTADDISYDAIPLDTPPEPEENGPLTLPELSLPITIDIEKFEINNFLFSSSPDSEPVSVHKAAIALSWDANGIQIETLDVAMDMASLQAQGKINPVGNYPLQLTTSLKTLNTDLPSLTIKGTCDGDLLKLKVRQDISGDATINLDVTLQEIISNLRWQGDIRITELRPAVFAPDIPGTLTGSLTTSGTLKQAEVTSTLSIRDPKAAEANWDADLDIQANLESLMFDIKQLSLQNSDTAAVLKLTGVADIEQNLDLALHWEELQWPVSGAADYSSPQGDATLKGSIDSFYLVLTAAISGNDIPDGKIRLNTNGNTESINDLQLTLALLDGNVNLQGDVEWSPTFKWNIKSDAQHINPGIQYPDWPGGLNWLIQTDGFTEENGLTANVTIDTLNGILRELPITGNGNIAIQPDDIHIQNLRLTSGSAVVTANGHLNEQSNLQWKADIADFRELLPQASGQFKATGTLQNKMMEPQLNIDLSGTSIAYADLALEHVKADASLDLSWSKPFSLALKADGLKTGENLIKTFSAQGKGTREQHSLHLKASHDMADISLTLGGGYLQGKWQGLLDELAIISTDIGTWSLQNPSKISASATTASLDTLCLRRDESDLCVQVMWNSENNSTKGDLQIHEIPLAWLSPWFPETLESLTGLFSAKAAVTLEERLSADVTAEITPGKITYRTNKKEGTLPHEGMKLTMKALEDALDADLHLSVNSNIVSGHLQSPNLLQTDIGDKAKLKGRILVDAKNFDLVETLISDVKDLDGAIDLDFTILGTIEKPDIKGKGQVNIDHVLIPVIGLDLSETNFDILAENKEITLKGTLKSPKGSMLLAGNATLDKEQNWPARFTLKGSNFRLVNLPDITIFLSSDILFEKKNGLMSLTGKATIPKADILLRELPPGSQSASPDMVIVQERKEEEVKSPFHMLLKIGLGKDVHFAGFGFNAFIDGQLTVLSEPEEQLIGSGAFYIKQGSFRAYGQDLDIETGVISFPGGPLSQPGINLRATRTVGDVVAGIYAIGPASKPRLTTFSNPPMSESLVISYLLTGSAPDQVGGTRLSIGRQINNKLSVAVGTDVKTGESEFMARYRLSRKIHVQTTTGSNTNAADIFYTIELEDEAFLKK